MKQIRLRPYTPEDLSAVVAVFRSNIPKYFTLAEEAGLVEYLRDHPQDYYVVLMNDEVCGAGGIARNPDDTVSLCWGMIEERQLGTGLGKVLTQFRIDLSKERFGALPLVISTSQHTRGFYEKFGFVLSHEVIDGFGPGIHKCEMRCDQP